MNLILAVAGGLVALAVMIALAVIGVRLTREITILRKEFVVINTAIAVHINKIARVLERWGEEGMPEERRVR